MLFCSVRNQLLAFMYICITAWIFCWGLKYQCALLLLSFLNVQPVQNL